MGFNKRYIQELSVLKKRRNEYSSDEEFFKAVVGNSDALMGPPESMSYLDSIYEKIRSNEGRKHATRKHTG